MAGVGHRYPTVEIYATGTAEPAVGALPEAPFARCRTWCTPVTRRRVVLVPTNEEWHYRPIGAGAAMPWRINLKWRVSTLAGFEGGTKINVNTISPFTLRQRIVDALLALRSAGRIEPMAIGDECSHRTGALHYAEG